MYKEALEIRELDLSELQAVSGGAAKAISYDLDGDWCGTRWPHLPFPPKKFDIPDIAGGLAL